MRPCQNWYLYNTAIEKETLEDYTQREICLLLLQFQMSQFCDDDNPSVKKEHRHQSFAQTRHNIACNYRSAWDVMRKHSDFQSMKNKIKYYY